MAISFVSGLFRNATRIRLYFDQTLAIGAFSTSWFAVETPDAEESPPITVIGALAIVGAANAVEVAIDQELLPGVRYEVTIGAGLPGSVDTLAADAVFLARTGGPHKTERSIDLVMPDLYGEDILFDGEDFVEAANGDLDVVGGLENLRGALNRRLLSEGLAWDAVYGVKARRFVDAPRLGLSSLRGDALRQIRSDDRVQSATATAGADLVTVSYVPIGGSADEPGEASLAR